jgi:hypothetical protein
MCKTFPQVESLVKILLLNPASSATALAGRGRELKGKYKGRGAEGEMGKWEGQERKDTNGKCFGLLALGGGCP